MPHGTISPLETLYRMRSGPVGSRLDHLDNMHALLPLIASRVTRALSDLGVPCEAHADQLAVYCAEGTGDLYLCCQLTIAVGLAEG
jgi:hypothetical protein